MDYLLFYYQLLQCVRCFFFVLALLSCLGNLVLQKFLLICFHPESVAYYTNMDPYMFEDHNVVEKNQVRRHCRCYFYLFFFACVTNRICTCLTTDRLSLRKAFCDFMAMET